MHAQFEVNVLGLLATTQAVLPHFRANRTGTIINVTSVGGRMAFPTTRCTTGPSSRSIDDAGFLAGMKAQFGL